MIERGSGASFPLKTLERLAVVSDILGQELEGDASPQLDVLSLVYDSHPALAELFDDPIVRQNLADFWHAGIPDPDTPTAMTSTG